MQARGAVKKADGIFARYNVRNTKTGATKWIIRCKRSLFEGSGRAESVLWASVMNADGVFARYNHTGCEIGQGLGANGPLE